MSAVLSGTGGGRGAASAALGPAGALPTQFPACTCEPGLQHLAYFDHTYLRNATRCLHVAGHEQIVSGWPEEPPRTTRRWSHDWQPGWCPWPWQETAQPGPMLVASDIVTTPTGDHVLHGQSASAWHDAAVSSRAGLVGLVVLLLAGACSADTGGSARAVPAGARQSAAGVPVTPDATQQGTPGWQLDRPANGRQIEAFADQASIRPGVSVGLFVSTRASAYTVQAFRFGAYRGSAAKLVWTSGSEPGREQAAAREIASTRTPYAPWQRSMQVPTRGWEPGDYLLKLQMAAGGQQSYVPLTVRSASTAGQVMIVNSVTDWQAYNSWGGRSLYQGPDGGRATRAYAVSFDRPYRLGQGAADFLSNERPLVSFADSLALPLAFVTDVDLDQDPHLLDGARAVISPGHDEYYSTPMRAALTVARDRGTNIAFLAANSVFRHIRLAPTALSPDRFEIDYKAYELDPERRINPDEVTVQWPDPPHPRPESALTAAMYQCNGVKTDLLVRRRQPLAPDRHRTAQRPGTASARRGRVRLLPAPGPRPGPDPGAVPFPADLLRPARTR